MQLFGPATRAWFEGAFEAPTPVQAQGWQRIASGEHSLLIAPTGSGKTLAAFLWCIDALTRRPEPDEPGVRVLYVSPLKALVYDVERNLRAPLVGIARAAELGGHAVNLPRVAVRTGDTPARDRQRQLKDPAEILVTTPESLYLLLTSAAAQTLRTVQTVIVDEVHALAPTKRGAHLALSLERLGAISEQDPQRIGLSATATPLDEVARFLGGDRPVCIVDTSAKPSIDLQIVVPVPDMTRPSLGRPDPELPVEQSEPDAVEADDPDDKEDDEPELEGVGTQVEVITAPPAMFEPVDNSIWPAIYPRLLELIDQHRTTIIFVNSRGLCERLAQRLNEAVDDPDLVRAHHGSVAREQREQIEEMLKQGQIKAIVATSSLELGIDMGAVDLVVLVESPGAVSRGLQRIGRAGHGVGEISRGRVFPKHRGDLLEAAVVTRRMREGQIEPIAYPRNPLDVLAQQIVAMVSERDWPVAQLQTVVRRAANFRDLPQAAFVGVLDMLSGLYPSHAFADLRPRITWDREHDVLQSRRGAKQVAIFNAGTIPDRGTYGVFLGEGGPRVGELDEEMVHESAAGQTIMLGASTWRIDEIGRDRVLVSPAPGEPGRLPFWRGDGPGRPAELGRAMGAFVAELAAKPREQAETWLQTEYDLDPWAARNLVDYVHEQRDHTSALPTDQRITVECFRDELGDWRVCILCPLGARVNAPWALAVQARLERHFGFEVQAMWSDDGIVLRLVEVDELPDIDLLLPDPEDVEEQIVEQLAHSALFAGQFRENAGRALLLPRLRANARTPLWAQRLKSQQLLAVARDYPSFPIIIETYRSCLEDVFDLPALVDLLGAIRRRDVKIDHVQTASPSPFAGSLVFAYVAAYLYEGDAPLAERKAQALALDRRLLRELLGREELRELLDAEVIEDLEAELQGVAEGFAARHLDDLHDRLRRVGDLDADEVQGRSDGPASEWVEELLHARRVATIRVGGRVRFIAIEDVGLYRDALGASPPQGVPAAFLEPVPRALEALVARYARTHGPFEAQALVARYELPAARVHDALSELERQGEVVRGAFRPGGEATEWCDAEILRRIKRRTLAKLRGEIAPVEPRALGRFLPQWHGIGQASIGPGRLEEALMQLEGLPLSYQELEQVLLPARVPGFAPRMLDELGAMGWLVWVGHGALGKNDGRVALYRRERVGLLLDPPAVPDDLGNVHRAILDHLKLRGASFFVELCTACGPDARIEEVREAVWDLVWAGLVTNDTLQAVRGYTANTRPTRARRTGMHPAAAGRWSLVADLIGTGRSETERAHARAVNLLERHGLVCREVAGLEPIPGGFSAVYRVLREMEEAGKVRRGYFVESLGGAQFASPGAVDRIRAAHRDERPEVVVLSALDPANPYGWLLPWPVRDDEQTAPRRVAGATVVLVGGEAALYLDRGGRRMLTFPIADDPETAVRAARALTEVAARQRGKILRIEKIDGHPARTSPHAPRLREAEFQSDPRGLLLEARR